MRNIIRQAENQNFGKLDLDEPLMSGDPVKYTKLNSG